LYRPALNSLAYASSAVEDAVVRAPTPVAKARTAVAAGAR
jgi:hypothetical protein